MSYFDELFVLELANNHWGSVDRGKKIISDYGQVVRFNDVNAAIKLQFRDVQSFVHEDYRDNETHRYVNKTLKTELSWEDMGSLVNAVRAGGMKTMATPFDEFSVKKCVEFDLDVIKIASSDIKDWFLIESIAKTRKPVIASSGGSSLKDLDDLVSFFEKRNIPFALNHCVSLYPSEDGELELDQIDFLKDRFPNTVIGFSTHEFNSWDVSMHIAYAKGARTFERHIDIDYQDVPVSPYCSLPEQVDTWFKAFKKAKEMCGGVLSEKRIPSRKEIEYLEALVRGVYAKDDLPAGHALTDDDVYLAIPLHKGQISCREFMRGEKTNKPLKGGQQIGIEDIEAPYSDNSALVQTIKERGI